MSKKDRKQALINKLEEVLVSEFPDEELIETILKELRWLLIRKELENTFDGDKIKRLVRRLDGGWVKLHRRTEKVIYKGWTIALRTKGDVIYYLAWQPYYEFAEKPRFESIEEAKMYIDNPHDWLKTTNAKLQGYVTDD